MRAEMNSIVHEQRSHEACKKCVFFWPPKKPQRVLILQDERRLDGILGSTPSPSTRDGEPLLHEVGRAHDSATRKIKIILCAHRAAGVKMGLIGHEQRSHDAFLSKRVPGIFFLATRKCRIFVFELNPKCSNTRRRRIAARSRESTRQHRTHASKMPLCTPCCWRDDGLDRPRVALTRRLLSKSVYFSWARKKSKCQNSVFELNPKSSYTRRRTTAARSSGNARQHRTHTKGWDVCTPCRWRKDGLDRPQAALTLSFLKKSTTVRLTEDRKSTIERICIV